MSIRDLKTAYNIIDSIRDSEALVNNIDGIAYFCRTWNKNEKDAIAYIFSWKMDQETRLQQEREKNK